MKLIILGLCSISLAVLLNSCKSDNSTNVTPQNNSGEVSTEVAVDTTFSLQKAIVHVYEGDVNLTTKLLDDTRKMSEKTEAMAGKVTDTLELSEELVKLLSKDFTLNSDYRSLFSINDDFDADKPFVAISARTSKHFLLVSSSTRLFTPRTSVKSYFNDSSSLLNAWQRALHSYKSGNLYMNIYEIKTDATSQRVGNTLLIPSAKMDKILGSV